MYIVFLPLIIVGMVFGGEMTVNVDTYKPPMRAETRAKYSISTNPKWRKKVAFKEWANIGHDKEKLFSIIEHYLRDKGFSYRSGVWNHTYIPWEEGFIFRSIGTLFLVVGIFIFSTLDTGIILVNLFPCIHIIIGAWVLLIGLGKIEFYHLRDDIFIKLIIVIFVVGWLGVLTGMFIDLNSLGI